MRNRSVANRSVVTIAVAMLNEITGTWTGSKRSVSSPDSLSHNSESGRLFVAQSGQVLKELCTEQMGDMTPMAQHPTDYTSSRADRGDELRDK